MAVVIVIVVVSGYGILLACTVQSADCICTFLWTTIFCGTQNSEPSRGIRPFPRNFYVFTEFCGIWYWMVIRGQIRHILMEFGPLYCMYR